MMTSNTNARDLPGSEKGPSLSQLSLLGAVVRAGIGLGTVDGKGRLSEANSALLELLALGPDDIDGQCVLADHIAVRDAFDAGMRHHDAFTYTLQAADGTFWRLYIDRPQEGARLIVATPAAASSVVDPAVRHFGDRAALELSIRTRFSNGDFPLSLLVIDIDNFRQVNDTLGTTAGDEFLGLAGRRILSATRADDAVFALGGDEFAVLTDQGLLSDGAETIAARVIELLQRPFLVRGHQLNLGASIGIAVSTKRGGGCDNLLRHANLALAEAKAAGRGVSRIFQPQMAERASTRHELESQLRRALDLKEFSLHYQPQVDLRSGEVTGFEALLRWHNAARGMIPPIDFIPLAEQTGEIKPIGSWVLNQACRDAVHWPQAFRLAVNVSSVQFETDFVAVVAHALESSGLPAWRLELEITETALLHNADPTLRQLWALREIGVGIAMDDFGTGYSSLSFLNSFPFSKIKIDQSFVRGEQSRRSQALVGQILSLGKALTTDTLAEGVETHAQYWQLRQAGCCEAQGYLISRPMPADQVEPFLAEYQPQSAGME